MRNRLRRWTLLALAMPLAGVLLMTMATLVPDRIVMEQLHDAVLEGSLTAENYGQGYTAAQTDGFSECKRMTIGLGARPGEGVFDTVIRSPTLGPCELAVPKIEEWADGEGLTRAYVYFRYWNGSASLLRPSIALFGLAGTRLLAGALLAASIGLFWHQLSRYVGRTSATLGVVPIVATTDFIDLPGGLVHAIGMLVAVTSATILLRLLRSDSAPSSFAAASFVAGAAFLFFGDLTNPDGAWVLASSSAAVVAISSSRSRAMANTFAAATGWIIGFAWMWASKWLIAVPVLGFETVRSNISNQAALRLAGDYDGDSGALLGSVQRAFDIWNDQPLMAPALIGCGLVALFVALTQQGLAQSWRDRAIILVPAAIPVFWHVVMRQHTWIHAWFTYRAFAMSAGVVFIALTAKLAMEPDPVGEVDHQATLGAASQPTPEDSTQSAEATSASSPEPTGATSY